MKVGDHAQCEHRFSAADLEAYQDFSGGEVHPDHVPEPLVNALFSRLLGTVLPGLGTAYLKQETHFVQGAPLDVPLTARVEVTDIRADKHLADLATTCHAPDGVLIAQGRALVYTRDVEHLQD
jgi:hypothetical protein